MDNRIKTIEAMVEIVEELRNEKKTIVTTSGSYDILHAGHVDFLEKARGLGDVLIVLLNSDDSIRRSSKGPDRPYIKEQDRAEMMAGLRAVDYVVIFNEDKPLEYMKKIRSHYHAKGGSWDRARLKEEIDLVESWGGKYETFPLREGLSTTNLVKAIRESSEK